MGANVQPGATLRRRLPKVSISVLHRTQEMGRSASGAEAAEPADSASRDGHPGGSSGKKRASTAERGSRRDLGWATPSSTTLSEPTQPGEAATTGLGGKAKHCCCLLPASRSQGEMRYLVAHAGGSGGLNCSAKRPGLRVIGRGQAGIRSPAGRPARVRLRPARCRWRPARTADRLRPGPLCRRRPRPDKAGTVNLGSWPCAGCPKWSDTASAAPQPGRAHHLLHFPASDQHLTG